MVSRLYDQPGRRTRAKIISYVRHFLDIRDFLEVETNVLDTRAEDGSCRKTICDTSQRAEDGAVHEDRFGVAPEDEAHRGDAFRYIGGVMARRHSRRQHLQELWRTRVTISVNVQYEYHSCILYMNTILVFHIGYSYVTP